VAQIHVIQDDWCAEVDVWLDTGVAECDGICIGTGDSTREALADAALTLARAINQLHEQAIAVGAARKES